MIAARPGRESRNRHASATGLGSRVSQPSGACRSHASARSRSPGCRARPWCARARRRRGSTRTPARAQVAGQVAVDRLQRGLGHAHPVVDRPGDGGVEVEADDRAAALRALEQRQQRRRRAPSARTRSCGRRARRDSGGVSGSSRRARPRGRRRSRAGRRRARPQRSSRSAATASRCAGSLTSSSSTSGSVGSRRAMRSVMPQAAAEAGEHDLGAVAPGRARRRRRRSSPRSGRR